MFGTIACTYYKAYFQINSLIKKQIVVDLTRNAKVHSLLYTVNNNKST